MVAPYVFLSLSGHDDAFVEKVSERLPQGLAVFYKKSFDNGENLISAMESKVDSAAIFCFFASQSSLKSPWVRFELDRARLSQIQRPNFRILVFPLSSDLPLRDFPQWVRDNWISGAGYSPSDIARYIRQVLTTAPVSAVALSVPVLGRGGLSDITSQRLMSAVADTHKTPNVFVFAGVTGIGRRTFARYFLDQALPGLTQLKYGPILQLPQFADIADIYRGLKEELDMTASVPSLTRDLEVFQSLETLKQVEEVVSLIGYFGRISQSVTILIASGLFDDRGNPKPWVAPLFTAMAQHETSVLVFISNRQFREEQLRSHSNVLQTAVPELHERDIQALMTATSKAYQMSPPFAPSTLLSRAIGGHPDVARAAVRLAHQRGATVLEAKPTLLFSIQEQILSENLDVSALSEMERHILCVLSWVPSVEGRILMDTLVTFESAKLNDVASALENLILGCLVSVTGNGFSIAQAIREMFRRKYGHGPANLLSTFSSALKKAWDLAVSVEEVRSQLLDSFIFMHALEGKSLPEDLSRLLMPATLQQLVSETYARGKQDSDEETLKKVASWGDVASRMRMDETVREEIFSYVIRANIRLRNHSLVETQLTDIAGRGYRSHPFLRGYSLRRQNKHKEAIPFLREAMVSGKYFRSAVQEIATCYHRLGRWEDLGELVEKHIHIIRDSASLLDFHVGLLISAGKISEAESAIEKLSVLPDNNGRSDIRRAQIVFQHHQRNEDAQRMLPILLLHPGNSQIVVRRWRALAAAYAGDFVTAQQDIEFVRSRNGGEGTAQRLSVHLSIARGDYPAAEAQLAKLGRHTIQDDLLRARLLEAQASDVHTPLAKREALKREAREIRARSNRNRSTTEYDVE